MVVESGQMLSTAHRVLDGILDRRPSKSGKTNVRYWDLYLGRDDLESELLLYKAVHVGHPCTQWTMRTSANYDWHYEHFIALAQEYTYRYGKDHKTALDLGAALYNKPDNLPPGPLTPFELAMGANPECMIQGDPVQSYRLFYQTKQERFKMVWTKRNRPEWFNNVHSDG